MFETVNLPIEQVSQASEHSPRMRRLAPKPTISDRFLHSNEQLRENEEGGNEHDEHETCSRCGWHVPGPVRKNYKNDKESVEVPDWQSWPRRHMHRSMSVDDMMEYQREFSTEHVCGSTIAIDLADYRQEFRELYAEHDPLPLADEVGDTSRVIRSKVSWLGRKFRKSIANSDLHEFKRQCSQNQNLGRMTPTQEVEDNKGELSQENPEDYQWGTHGLPKSKLGSDLTRFERTMQTALLVSSRENSAGSIDANQSEAEEESARRAHQSSMMPPTSVNGHEQDWGTRSLRRTIQQLECVKNTAYTYYVDDENTAADDTRHCETVYEDGGQQDFSPALKSPWHDDDNVRHAYHFPKKPCRVTSTETSPIEMMKEPPRPSNAMGIKMPQRVQSVEIPDGPKTPQRAIADGDAKILPTEEKTEGLRSILRGSPIRRSISSSDIEKYHRPTSSSEDLGAEHIITSSDSTLDHQNIDSQSAHTASAVECFRSQESRGNVNPLLQAMELPPWSPREESHGNTRYPGRHHRRSTSDVPELHMEESLTDVAPRKPRRTHSRADLPGPPERPFVRFAEEKTTVVEIPKVSDEMKPYLFYTKRDVKKFRMNEYRRQEHEIKEYMEYLNQKPNALEDD